MVGITLVNRPSPAAPDLSDVCVLGLSTTWEYLISLIIDASGPFFDYLRAPYNCDTLVLVVPFTLPEAPQPSADRVLVLRIRMLVSFSRECFHVSLSSI